MPLQIEEERMRRIVVFMSLTADGVMQAPGRPDEDRRGGFAYGGWAKPYGDSGLGSVAGGPLGARGAVLLRRRAPVGLRAGVPTRPKPKHLTRLLHKLQKEGR